MSIKSIFLIWSVLVVAWIVVYENPSDNIDNSQEPHRNAVEQAQFEWSEFAQKHNCKIIEQGIYRGMFTQRDNLWLCDDGVKYYKPESFK